MLKMDQNIIVQNDIMDRLDDLDRKMDELMEDMLKQREIDQAYAREFEESVADIFKEFLN